MIIFLLGVFYTCYGIAGILGRYNIQQKFEGHSWTKEYKRACGISSLMQGLPWIVLSALQFLFSLPFYVVILSILLFSIPSIWYSIRFTRYYTQKLEEEHPGNTQLLTDGAGGESTEKERK